MSIIYSTPTQPTLKVQELPTVTATTLKNSTADVLDQAATHGAVAITRHDKARAVLVSVEHYERLTGAESNLINELHAEYRGVLEQMQAPEQKEAALRAFNATPEEMGKAAVAGAKRR